MQVERSAFQRSVERERGTEREGRQGGWDRRIDGPPGGSADPAWGGQVVEVKLG